jgi:hypothetical protein
MQTPLTFFFAFVVVLALIGLAAWLVRRFAGNRLGANAGRGRLPRLAVIDAAAVDGRRRLVLVRRDNVEHLLMIGGPTDIVVEPNIVRALPAREQQQRPGTGLGSELAPRAPLEPTNWPTAETDAAPEHVEPAIPEPVQRPARPSFIDEPRRPFPPLPERRPDPVASFTPEPPVRPELPVRPEPRLETRPEPQSRTEPTPRSEPVMPRATPRSEMPRNEAAPRSEPAMPRPSRPLETPVRMPAPPPVRSPERASPPPIPTPAQVPMAPPPAANTSISAADQNLADMAQRLEAALRRPVAEPRTEAPPVAPEPSPNRPVPRSSEVSVTPPSRSEPSSAPPVAPPVTKTGFENLEDEMASLLGRPKSTP